MTENIPKPSISSRDTSSSLTLTNSSQTHSSIHNSIQETASSQSTVTETNLSNKEPEEILFFLTWPQLTLKRMFIKKQMNVADGTPAQYSPLNRL